MSPDAPSPYGVYGVYAIIFAGLLHFCGSPLSTNVAAYNRNEIAFVVFLEPAKSSLLGPEETYILKAYVLVDDWDCVNDAVLIGLQRSMRMDVPHRLWSP